MRILTRYFLKAHVAPFLFALSALTLIMLLDQLGKRFGKLVGKGLDWTVIVEVFALSLPFILAMTLPMAVLLAVLYTFNRMASDNEITALKANGVHLPSLMLPVLGVAAVLAGGMVWFNNTILPESNHRLQVLLTSISQKKPTFVLREQTVNEVLSGELYIQVARLHRETNRLDDVVIYDEREPQHSRTIYADRGTMAYSDDRTDLYLTLFDGVNQQQKLNEPEAYQRMRFQKLVMRVPDVTNRLRRQELGGYRGDREMPIGQMRDEVDRASLSARAAAEESRHLAVNVTRRLLGRELERPPDPEPTRPRRAGAEGGEAVSDDGGADTAPADEPPARAAAAAGTTAAAARGTLASIDAAASTDAAGEAAAGADADAADDQTWPRSSDVAAARRAADSAARGDSGDAAGEAGDPGDRAADTAASPDDGAGRTLDSATRAAIADSVLQRAELEAYDAALRVRSLYSVGSQFSSLETRREAALSRANRFGVEIHKKVSIPAACLVFVLIGAPLAVRFRQGGVAMVVAASLLFFCSYYVSLVVGEELADELILSPFWAMWAPNVLFGGIGLGLVWRAVKVG